jgi:hypothetical protein
MRIGDLTRWAEEQERLRHELQKSLTPIVEATRAATAALAPISSALKEAGHQFASLADSLAWERRWPIAGLSGSFTPTFPALEFDGGWIAELDKLAQEELEDEPDDPELHTGQYL